MQAFFDSCVWILGNHPKNHTPASDSNLPPPSIMQDAFSQTIALKRRILAITGLAFLVLAGWLWLGKTSTINPLARKLSMRLESAHPSPIHWCPKHSLLEPGSP